LPQTPAGRGRENSSPTYAEKFAYTLMNSNLNFLSSLRILNPPSRSIVNKVKEKRQEEQEHTLEPASRAEREIKQIISRPEIHRQVCLFFQPDEASTQIRINLNVTSERDEV
jgi:hypothetical protein